MTDIGTRLKLQAEGWQVMATHTLELTNDQELSIHSLSVPFPERILHEFQEFLSGKSDAASSGRAIGEAVGLEVLQIADLGPIRPPDRETAYVREKKFGIPWKRRILYRVTNVDRFHDERQERIARLTDIVGVFVQTTLDQDDLVFERLIVDQILDTRLAKFGSPPHEWLNLSWFKQVGHTGIAIFGIHQYTQDPMLVVASAGVVAFVYIAKPSVKVLRRGIAERVAKAIKTSVREGDYD